MSKIMNLNTDFVAVKLFIRITASTYVLIGIFNNLPTEIIFFYSNKE